MKVIGIDPGETIGLSHYSGTTFIHGMEVQNLRLVISYIERIKPDQVVMEDFIVNTSRPSRAKIPLEQIGVIKYYCQEHGISIALQSPSSLHFALKRVAGLHTSPHVRSSAAHVLYWLIKNKVK